MARRARTAIAAGRDGRAASTRRARGGNATPRRTAAAITKGSVKRFESRRNIHWYRSAELIPGVPSFQSPEGGRRPEQEGGLRWVYWRGSYWVWLRGRSPSSSCRGISVAAA